MARISPDLYNPIASWRFKVVFSSLKDVSFYAKAIQMPTIDNGTLVMDYGNTQLKVKGKTKWNDIELTFYAYENMTLEQLWDYMNQLLQEVEPGKDFYGDDYKKDILIQVMKPNDEVHSTWTLVGAYANIINFGEFDYSTEEVVQPRMTISYDYALYKGNQGYQFT